MSSLRIAHRLAIQGDWYQDVSQQSDPSTGMPFRLPDRLQVQAVQLRQHVIYLSRRHTLLFDSVAEHLHYLVDSPEGAQVVGIAFEKTPIDEIRSFVAELGVNYPVLIIGEEPLVPMEPLKGLPSTFLISPEGQVVHSHVGPVTEDELTEWLARYASG